jgi:hypothetical protein
MRDRPGFRFRTRWTMALRYSGLPASTRAVAWALATWFTTDGTGADPSLATLAEAAGLDPATVKRALNELERGWWITRVRGGGRGVRTHYSAAMPADAEAALEAVLNRRTDAPVSGRKQAHGMTETGARTRPIERENWRTHAPQAFKPVEPGRENALDSENPAPIPDAILERMRRITGADRKEEIA